MDFRQKLKTRFYYAVAYIVIGLVLTICAYVTKSKNYFISSFGIALIVCGIMRLIQYFRITKNEKSFKKQEITETDERNIMLAHRARSLAFVVYIVLTGTAVIILSIAGKHESAQLISYSICLLVALYWICYHILRKKY